MKKIILAFVAIALSFAISSCCDQSHCFGKNKCLEQEDDDQVERRNFQQSNQGEETPYRFDKANKQEKRCTDERQHRRW